MAPEPGRALRPMRINRDGSPGGGRVDLPAVPVHPSPRSVAPDWVGPTEDNGVHLPRAELHVALVAPDAATAKVWRKHARIIQPPLWPGKVKLHVVTVQTDARTDILMVLVDLGLIDAKDAGIIGYPSGYEEET